MREQSDILIHRFPRIRFTAPHLGVMIKNKNIMQSYFLHLEKGILTYANIVVIITYYIIWLFTSNTIPREQYHVMYLLGNRSYYQIIHGDYYGVITNAFFHLNLLHLSFNALTLLLTGIVIEKYFGKIKYCLIWLFGATLPCLHYFIIFKGGLIGISDVIYTFWGILLSMQFIQKKLKVSIYIHLILGGGFFICFLLSALNIMNIANSVHVSSIIVGVIISFLIKPIKRDHNQKAQANRQTASRSVA